MKRRDFITLLGGAAAVWPLAARAQQLGKARLVGALIPFEEGDEEADRRRSAFQRGLEELGWTNGQNIRIEFRWVGSDRGRIRDAATELVGLKPDVILVSTALILAPLQQRTSTIPIVFTHITDPVSSGFVASLARPGGNVTGFAPAEFSMYGKLLEALKEAAAKPDARRYSYGARALKIWIIDHQMARHTLTPEDRARGRERRVGHLQQAVRYALWASRSNGLPTSAFLRWCYPGADTYRPAQRGNARRAAQRFAVVVDHRGREAIWRLKDNGC
jgi:hypothetical protein